MYWGAMMTRARVKVTMVKRRISHVSSSAWGVVPALRMGGGVLVRRQRLGV